MLLSSVVAQEARSVEPRRARNVRAANGIQDRRVSGIGGGVDVRALGDGRTIAMIIEADVGRVHVVGLRTARTGVAEFVNGIRWRTTGGTGMGAEGSGATRSREAEDMPGSSRALRGETGTVHGKSRKEVTGD